MRHQHDTYGRHYRYSRHFIALPPFPFASAARAHYRRFNLVKFDFVLSDDILFCHFNRWVRRARGLYESCWREWMINIVGYDDAIDEIEYRAGG